MYEGLKHAHSGLRWIFLILLLLAVVNAFIKWKGNGKFSSQDQKLNLFTFIFSHIQLLLGLMLYFISPKVQFTADVMKNAAGRFFTVEHMMMMLIAIILITIGYGKAKRAIENRVKFKTTFMYYFIALLLILIAIPWPPRHGASWF